MFKEDLALNNLQWLICHKTKHSCVYITKHSCVYITFRCKYTYSISCFSETKCFYKIKLTLTHLDIITLLRMISFRFSKFSLDTF